MRGLISVFAGLLATSVMAWAEPCKVAQTGTLNVHGEPNGRIVGTLNEGTMVSMSSVITVRRHRWAKIGLLQGRTGWVLRNYLLCEGLSAASGIQRIDRKRYPYELPVIRGKLYMPAEHAGAAENVNDEMRAVAETLWPDLVHKLP